MVVENSLERMDLDLLGLMSGSGKKSAAGWIEFQHLMLLMRMKGG